MTENSTSIRIQTVLPLPASVFYRLEDMRRDMNQADLSETIISVLNEYFRLSREEGAVRLLNTVQERILRRALEAGKITTKELQTDFKDSGNNANIGAINRKLRPRLGDKALVPNEDSTGFVPNPGVVEHLRQTLGMSNQPLNA